MTAPSDRVKTPALAERLLGMSFLFTGAGLVGHIVFGVPLRVAVLFSFAGASALFSALYLVGPVNEVNLRNRILLGVRAGVAATVAYDVVRALAWKFFLSGVWPFEAFRFFGRGLLGEGTSPTPALVAGTVFHLVNGILFSVTYVVSFGSRSIVWAVAWALMLETLTLVLYPNWLGISRFTEFAEISALGHVAYGLTLGLVVKRARLDMKRGAHE